MATKASKSTTTALAAAAAKHSAVATIEEDIDFSDGAGEGMEGATADSFAIPFLSVLQKGSPQVDETSGVALEGAKAGMLFENVTGRLYDGKVGVNIIPCAYRRVFVRWGPKGSEGPSFRGELSPEEVAAMRARGDIADVDGKLLVKLPDGTLNEKKCDTVRDTRNHYILIVDPDGGWTNALLSLSSTQVKKSRMLMSALGSVKKIRRESDGAMVEPATYASLVHVSTVPESNDKGSWYGIRFEIVGRTPTKDLYAAAKAFNRSVREGVIESKYDDAAATEPAADSKF